LPDHRCGLEAANRPWQRPLEAVGAPRLSSGDKLHHKLAVISSQIQRGLGGIRFRRGGAPSLQQPREP